MTPTGPENDNARGQAGNVGKANSDQQVGFSYLSGRPVKPTFPDMSFLPGRVFGVLLTGVRMSSNDSLRLFGHSRVADSIWKLRKLGWNIHCAEETLPTRDAGRLASVGFYFLDAETIAAAGEEGQSYAEEAARREAERRAA